MCGCAEVDGEGRDLPSCGGLWLQLCGASTATASLTCLCQELHIALTPGEFHGTERGLDDQSGAAYLMQIV